MRHLSIFQGIVCFILIFAIAPPVLAGEPTDQVKQTTDKVIAVLTDPALEDIDKTEEKRKLLRQIADERFDWEEIVNIASVAGLALLVLSILLVGLREFIADDLASMSSIYQGSIRFNTYIGLATIDILFGERGLATAALCLAVYVPLVNVLSVI